MSDHPSLRRRFTSVHPSSPASPAAATSPLTPSPSSPLVSTTPRVRPRSYSCYPSSKVTTRGMFLFDSSLLASLDLPSPGYSMPLQNALWSLKDYLLGRLDDAEESVRSLRVLVEESSDYSDAEEEWEVVKSRKRRGKERSSSSVEPLVRSTQVLDQMQKRDEAIGTLAQFCSIASSFLLAVRAELPTLSAVSPTSESSSASSSTGSSTESNLPEFATLSTTTNPALIEIQLSPSASLSLSHFFQDHPIPSLPFDLPSIDLASRLDKSKKSATTSAAALLSTLQGKLAELEQVLTYLTHVSLPAKPSTVSSSSSTTAGTTSPDLPLSTPLSDSHLPDQSPSEALPFAALRAYFHSESDRLSLALSQLSAKLSTTKTNIRARSSTLIQNSINTILDDTTAVLDEAARMYHAAVDMGKSRLLVYEELPHEWRNNEFIRGGYRYIAMDRWGALLRSAFEWHNETLNIQSHLLGSLSLIYLLIFHLPTTPFRDDRASNADLVIALVFIGAAIKCLLCSAAWHLFSGCASGGWHRRAACVDYVGISALIAASVCGMEFYGFYCRPELAVGYMAFSTLLGVAGMVLPWQPWFNERRFKMWRISFFLSLAASALMPMFHMGLLYGFWNTTSFFTPVIPSISAYLVGLSFYANQFPEMMAPGRWDHIGASHQLWHAAIVIAVWMHWRALVFWAGGAIQGDELSCQVETFARRALELVVLER